MSLYVILGIEVPFCHPLLVSMNLINVIPFSHPNATPNASHVPYHLVHLGDELVDVLFPVSEITTLDEVLEFASLETTSRVRKLERPQKVSGLLEVGAHGVDLVDQILNADDAILAKAGFDNLVVGKSNALLVNLPVTTLVDQLADSLQRRVAVCDVGLDRLDHLAGGLGELDEDTGVDLKKTKELEDLAGLRRDLVDTLDADNEDELVLGRNVVLALLLCKAGKANGLALGIAVFLDVRLGTLEDVTTLLLVGLCMQSALTNVAITRKQSWSRAIRPERWYVMTATLTVSSRIMCGHTSSLGLHQLQEICSRTAFLFLVSAARSSRAFSWLLRFFKSVSGTRMWS